MLASFGSGRLYGTRGDVANSTPVEFAVLQGVDVDVDFTTKPIFGQNQYPIFVARGEAKFTLKAKSANISGLLFNSIFFGGSMTTGQIAAAMGEAHTVPSTSPYMISAANAATFSTDEGVTYASGTPPLPLTKSSSAPSAIAQYQPSTSGVYTFSSSDAGASVLLSYLYSVTAGEQIAITNQLLGTTPYFSAVFRNRDPKTGLYDTLVINQATSSKLSLSSKTSDYRIPEFDMEVCDNGSGSIATWSFGDLS